MKNIIFKFLEIPVREKLLEKKTSVLFTFLTAAMEISKYFYLDNTPPLISIYH